MSGTTMERTMKDLKDNIPFLFPKCSTRIENGLPRKIVQQWADMSHFFFFLNGLITKEAIGRFLMAQRIGRLEDIAFAFDIMGDDLLPERERKEGAKLQEKHRGFIVSEILTSVTR